MDWGWPQYVEAGLLIAGLGYALAKNGEPRDGEHSFGVALVSVAITVWLLYMGGFWTGGH